MKRSCVWCSQAANSKEHVFPQWMRRLEAPARYIAKHGRYQEPMKLWVPWVDGDKGFVEAHIARGKLSPLLHEVQVKQVCVGCNTGWMSKLEVDIEPLFRRLTVWPSGSLTPAEALRLAIWGHKTILMYEQSIDPRRRRYTQEDYESFYQDRLPYGDVRLFVAASDAPVAQFAAWSDSNWLIPPDEDGQNFVAEQPPNHGSGYLAADGLTFIEHWFSPTFPNTWSSGGRGIRSRSEKILRRLGAHQVWPPTQKTIAWPTKVLNGAEADAARLSLLSQTAGLPRVAQRIPDDASRRPWAPPGTSVRAER